MGPAPTKVKRQGPKPFRIWNSAIVPTAEDVPKTATVVVALCGQVRVRRWWKAAAPRPGLSPPTLFLDRGLSVLSCIPIPKGTYLLARDPIREAMKIEWLPSFQAFACGAVLGQGV